MRQHRALVIAVNFGTRSRREVREHARRLWGEMAEWLKHGTIPNDLQLKTDLSAPTFKFDAQHRVVLESKADMKKRGLKSPDAADALALTFKARIHERYQKNWLRSAPLGRIWKQQADYILPRRFRDTPSMRKPAGPERQADQQHADAGRAHAGQRPHVGPHLAGAPLVPPLGARRWPSQRERQRDVKRWLNAVEDVLREVLIRSNIYNCLAHIYGDLGTYCTAAMIVEEDAARSCAATPCRSAPSSSRPPRAAR
jgi:hypothetical protein